MVQLAETIERWNREINLVSRKDMARLVSYHFCDAASLLALLRPDRPVRMLDIGGSNGLPGLILTAVSPHIDLDICDSKRKRKPFMDEACALVGQNARFEVDRIDSPGFRARYAEAFDLVVARAVTRLRLLFRWCAPLLKPGGRLVAYKGSRCFDEVKQAEGYVLGHSGDMIMVIDSPWAEKCNPLRLYAIAGKGVD